MFLFRDYLIKLRHTDGSVELGKYIDVLRCRNASKCMKEARKLCTKAKKEMGGVWNVADIKRL